MKRIKSIKKFSDEIVAKIKKIDDKALDQLIIDSDETAKDAVWWFERRFAEIVCEVATNEREDRIERTVHVYNGA